MKDASANHRSPAVGSARRSTTSPLRIRALLWSAFLGGAVSLSLTLAYLALAGPAYYVSHRLAIRHPPFFQMVKTGCQPAESIAVGAPFYRNYLRWCADKGVDARRGRAR